MGHHHRGDEIGAEGQGFKARPQGLGAAGPVRAGDQTHARLLQGRGHAGQEIGAGFDVAVRDHYELVPGPELELAQDADLGVVPQGFRAQNHLQPPGRGLPAQVFKERQNRVIRVGHPEEDLVRLVVLAEKAQETLPALGGQAFDGFEHSDAGGLRPGRGRGLAPPKAPQGKECQELVGQGCNHQKYQDNHSNG